MVAWWHCIAEVHQLDSWAHVWGAIATDSSRGAHIGIVLERSKAADFLNILAACDYITTVAATVSVTVNTSPVTGDDLLVGELAEFPVGDGVG